ncbi:pyridoxamine 5'-phosphate oxidase family protein [Hylemonella gracilis]|uniref:Pyridoxamine 5'-phosphate oxidase-like protein n=1 Tax=Hylemonella gracilis ATCC 19624 TaxID=887062 RepID=F3KS52_9BURK|nr:pyridoxamine 5'-phosphate oxidase family protein [Hylemonella gracilis]EGI77412.1 pyridoxamine 5'-phosphate oxidase-like protein [Hylemonella gracilis ATCC 19624]
MKQLLGPDIQAMAQRSVLCWLATVDASGQPNVSPKEIFAVLDSEHIVVANIASPGSARNIRANAKVCLSFIDVFAQKGYKVLGLATEAQPSDADYARWADPLRAMAGERFPIHSVFVVRATKVEPIVAPSYRLYPLETSEAMQIEAALRAYGVWRADEGGL